LNNWWGNNLNNPVDLDGTYKAELLNNSVGRVVQINKTDEYKQRAITRVEVEVENVEESIEVMTLADRRQHNEKQYLIKMAKQIEFFKQFLAFVDTPSINALRQVSADLSKFRVNGFYIPISVNGHSYYTEKRIQLLKEQGRLQSCNNKYSMGNIRFGWSIDVHMDQTKSNQGINNCLKATFTEHTDNMVNFTNEEIQVDNASVRMIEFEEGDRIKYDQNKKN